MSVSSRDTFAEGRQSPMAPISGLHRRYGSARSVATVDHGPYAWWPRSRAYAGRGRDGMRHIQLVFPRDDIDFVALVDFAAVDSHHPAELERRLRETYPSATVRARDLSGDPAQIWYVYRDGSWSPTPSV